MDKSFQPFLFRLAAIILVVSIPIVCNMIKRTCKKFLSGKKQL